MYIIKLKDNTIFQSKNVMVSPISINDIFMMFAHSLYKILRVTDTNSINLLNV